MSGKVNVGNWGRENGLGCGGAGVPPGRCQWGSCLQLHETVVQQDDWDQTLTCGIAPKLAALVPLPRVHPVINGVSFLETKCCNGKTHHILLVHFHAPSSQNSERRHHRREAGADIGPHTMADLLAMADCGQHRQHGFHQHLGIPGPARTDFHVDGIAGLGMKTGSCQNNHLAVKLRNQGVKMRVVDVGGGAVPGTDQAPLDSLTLQRLIVPSYPGLPEPFSYILGGTSDARATIFQLYPDPGSHVGHD